MGMINLKSLQNRMTIQAKMGTFGVFKIIFKIYLILHYMEKHNAKVTLYIWMISNIPLAHISNKNNNRNKLKKKNNCKRNNNKNNKLSRLRAHHKGKR